MIVGGGIVGVAAAFFLAQRGERDVLVLERDRLGSGTTKGGLGGIRHQFVDELDVRLSQLATAFWRSFEEQTGARHDFQERGYLFIAETEEGARQLREPLPLYERLRVPVRMVDRGEIAELVPSMRVDDLAGGRFCPRDGYGDPLGALAGLAAAARLGRVAFREGVAVTSLVRDGDRVTGVRTASGDVAARRILVAAGCWTSTLCASASVAVPPALEPWVRARAAWRHPAFADLRIVDTWSCYYEMTPDDHPVVGAAPGVAGLYLAAGFSGHGFMHAPAIGQLVVEEMLDGKARTLDIADLSLERFQTGRRPFKATVL